MKDANGALETAKELASDPKVIQTGLSRVHPRQALAASQPSELSRLANLNPLRTNRWQACQGLFLAACRQQAQVESQKRLACKVANQCRCLLAGRACGNCITSTTTGASSFSLSSFANRRCCYCRLRHFSSQAARLNGSLRRLTGKLSR